jgi:transposase-like protein
VYPIVYFDALHVKVREDRSVRTRACYLAVGVTVDGDREALGIWWPDTEGAKYRRRSGYRPRFRHPRPCGTAAFSHSLGLGG